MSRSPLLLISLSAPLWVAGSAVCRVSVWRRSHYRFLRCSLLMCSLLLPSRFSAVSICYYRLARSLPCCFDVLVVCGSSCCRLLVSPRASCLLFHQSISLPPRSIPLFTQGRSGDDWILRCRVGRFYVVSI